MIKFIFISSY